MKESKALNVDFEERSNVLIADEKSNKESPSLKKQVYFFSKRIFDIICSLIGCVGIVFFYIIIKAINICNKDYSSVIYSQKRIGKNGVEFEFYKFRSMIPDADEALKQILKEDEDLALEYKINKKLNNDPRITKLGAFLRTTSLDEIPQFFNVLKGDMSLIGNRPYLPREKEDMGEYFEDIVKTKCGIISYWAVNGRNDVSFEERLKLESYYSNHQSLILDLKIFISVFRVILLKKGAR